MSISIYSFINDKNISNSELKTYYDVIQVNEDKLHSKLSKLTLRKLRKLGGKESVTDSELVGDLVNKMREQKELVIELDKKIERSLDDQERIINEYQSITFKKDLEKGIMKERMEYEKYIRKYVPIDITKFERIPEYNILMELK